MTSTPETAKNIGVVVPTCGIRDFLWETLDSVFAAKEKCSPGEIIVCVNAGRESHEIAEQIRVKAGDWLQILPNSAAERIPMAENWNRCVSLISTEYVHLLHDDDKISPYFYDAMAEMMLTNPGGSLYSCACLLFGNREGIFWGPDAEGLWPTAVQELSRKNGLAAPGVIFSKTAFGCFDARWRQVMDWHAWHSLAQTGPAYHTRHPHAYYRFHQDNTTLSAVADGSNAVEARSLINELQTNKHTTDYSFVVEHCFEYARTSIGTRHYKAAFAQINQARLSGAPKFQILKFMIRIVLNFPRRQP